MFSLHIFLFFNMYVLHVVFVNMFLSFLLIYMKTPHLLLIVFASWQLVHLSEDGDGWLWTILGPFGTQHITRKIMEI